jgi:hypothetical protein
VFEDSYEPPRAGMRERITSTLRAEQQDADVAAPLRIGTDYPAPVLVGQRSVPTEQRKTGLVLRSVAVGIVVAIAVAVVLGGSLFVFRHNGPSATAPRGAAHHSTPSPQPPQSEEIVVPHLAYTLPAGYQQPQFLTADPQRRGVWFLTGNDVRSSMAFVSVNSAQDRIYPLPQNYEEDATGGIAIATDGTVWAGIHMTLIHLYPSTGTVKTYHLGTPGYHYIDSVAASGSGTVALGVAYAPLVVIFHDGKLTSWPLPAKTQAQDVAYLSDGTLGVTLDDEATGRADRFVTFSPGGLRSESPPVLVWSVLSTGTRFVTVALQIVVFDARAQVTGEVPFVPTINPESFSGFDLGILPDGDLMTTYRAGLLVANISTGETTELQLPRTTCPNPDDISPPFPADTPTMTPYPAGYLCPQSAGLMAADGAGDIWMTLGNQSQIDVVAAGGVQ